MGKTIQKPGVMAALVVGLLLTGYVTIPMTTTVGEDGEVNRMHFELVMDETTYAMWLEKVEEDGYDSVSEALAHEIEEEEPGIDGATDYNDRIEDDEVIVTVAFEDVTVDEISGVTTDVTDDETVVFSDTRLEELRDETEGELIYRVDMPGEIVETNADEVDGDNNIAVWSSDTDTETAYVESKTDDGFSLAPIGVGLSLLGIAIIAAVFYLRFRD